MQGEIDFILADLKNDSESILKELAGVEEMLVDLQQLIAGGSSNREELVRLIQRIRDKIGRLEHLDAEEFKEESATSNLVGKLRGMINKCI